MTTRIDSDGVLHAAAMSDLTRRPESISLHDMEFGISLGAVGAFAGKTDAPGASAPAKTDAFESGDLVVRSNIADKKDDFYVPGELLYTYNSTYFSRAKNPPKVQEDERLYYQPCAVCKKPSNDPDCRCGRR
ncbi:hypothetical protein GS575_11295 [Rhodococcus hoagii]|nr:hypothetical protein [Prescottella equi]